MRRSYKILTLAAILIVVGIGALIFDEVVAFATAEPVWTTILFGAFLIPLGIVLALREDSVLREENIETLRKEKGHEWANGYAKFGKKYIKCREEESSSHGWCWSRFS